MVLPEAKQLRGAAQVVYARPDAILPRVERQVLLDHLAESERARHDRFHFDSDRDAYLVAHALTRCVLATAACVAPRDLDFAIGDRGKPEVCGPAAALDLRFNLSHTRGLVACAVTHALVIGVDVERVDRRVDLLPVARHVFSEREVAGLTALSGEAQRLRFFELWTLKEAYVKAIGKGLAGPLRAITFAPDGPDPVPVHFAAEAADDARAWCFRRHALADGFRLAVALRAAAPAAASFSEASVEDLRV